jgi:hypothetical protein
MNAPFRFLGAFLLLFAVAVISLASLPSTSNGDQTDITREKTPDGMEVLQRGPIHEAFAQPIEANPQPSPPVPKQPPPPIPEVPPDQKPEGSNVQWIPGYWSWDSDRKDFIWVSGVYRNMPEGRAYTPGYWTQTADGWRWVPGYFASEGQTQTQYVPQPPTTVENGPSSPAPGDDYFYSPGSWVYDGSQFLWRPGFWAPYQSGLVWVNSYYTWTPAGYTFVPGYWDYPLANRGLLFAPVYFNTPLWNTPGWCYRPRILVGLANLLNYLFWRPGYPGYFYGGYYGPYYAGLGFQPWFGGPFWFNPLFNYYRWHYRGNPGWFPGIQNVYRNTTIVNRTNNFLTPLNRFQGNLTRVTPSQMNLHKSNIQHFQQLVQNRNRLETTAARAGLPASGFRTVNFNTGKIGQTTAASGFANKGPGATTIRSFTPGGIHAVSNWNGTHGKQGLVGKPPASTLSTTRIGPLGGNSTYGKVHVPSNFANLQSFHPKTNIVGTQRHNTVQSFYPRVGGVTNPSGVGHSNFFFTPSRGSSGFTSPSRNFTPSRTFTPPAAGRSFHVPTYRPAPSMHFGGGGGQHFGGAHFGGGHGGGHGGHR